MSIKRKIPKCINDNGVSAANMAISNISFRFSCVNAEHSICV